MLAITSTRYGPDITRGPVSAGEHKHQSPGEVILHTAPIRPDLGVSGKSIQLRTNFFEILSLPCVGINHYTVTITPELPPVLNRKVFQKITESSEGRIIGDFQAVYDGRSTLYTTKQFPFTERRFQLDIDNSEHSPKDVVVIRTGSYCLDVQFANVITMDSLRDFLGGLPGSFPTPAMEVLDVLLRFKPSMLLHSVGRSFFSSQHSISLSGAAECWLGYHQSLKPTFNKMLLNVDVSATAFYEASSVIAVCCKILGRDDTADFCNGLTDADRQRFEKFLKGIKICVTHRGPMKKRFSVHGLTKTSVSRTMFQISDSDPEISVEAYFQTRYNIRLQFPHLPCIRICKPNKALYLPLEVCELARGQRHVKKLSEVQTAQMIKITCQDPVKRSANIRKGMTELQHTDNEYLSEFGVRLGKEMMTLHGRMLEPPMLCYHPSSLEATVTPKDGVWNLRDKKVAVGVHLVSWAIVCLAPRREISPAKIEAFVNELMAVCTDLGIHVENNHPSLLYCQSTNEVEQTLRQAWVTAGKESSSQPQLLLCLLPSPNIVPYAEIKRVCDTELGVASQCLQAKHIAFPKRQYCANVCLKLNVKLGGMNVFLTKDQIPFISDIPTVIFGCEVSHANDGQKPSIAAVVASMDAKASQYVTSVRIQRRSETCVLELEDMVTELLLSFYKTCQVKPQKILFYRDGMSDCYRDRGDLVHRELDSIKRACARLGPHYSPPITYVLVHKRHHARFFPVHRADTDRSGNAPPGTVVETSITHPTAFDFYLCSHAGVQGTSRPTYYHVAHDDNGLLSDQLQELTYRLCYLYARCTRSVSIVPPVYYAQLVAFRARFHLTRVEGTNRPMGSLCGLSEEKLGADSSSHLDDGSGGSLPKIAPIKAPLNNVMYFL